MAYLEEAPSKTFDSTNQSQFRSVSEARELCGRSRLNLHPLGSRRVGLVMLRQEAHQDLVAKDRSTDGGCAGNVGTGGQRMIPFAATFRNV